MTSYFGIRDGKIISLAVIFNQPRMSASSMHGPRVVPSSSQRSLAAEGAGSA
jgi:hypothetical protein